MFSYPHYFTPPPDSPLYTYLDQRTYDLCLKNVANGKNLGPYQISHCILKKCQHVFTSTHCYYLFIVTNKNKSMHPRNLATQYFYTKMATFVTHKPQSTQYTNYQCTLTIILSKYDKRLQTLHDSQEGFPTKRKTTHQLQILILALKNV